MSPQAWRSPTARRRAELYVAAAGAQLGHRHHLAPRLDPDGGGRRRARAHEAGTRTLMVDVNMTYALRQPSTPIGRPTMDVPASASAGAWAIASGRTRATSDARPICQRSAGQDRPDTARRPQCL